MLFSQTLQAAQPQIRDHRKFMHVDYPAIGSRSGFCICKERKLEIIKLARTTERAFDLPSCFQTDNAACSSTTPNFSMFRATTDFSITPEIPDQWLQDKRCCPQLLNSSLSCTELVSFSTCSDHWTTQIANEVGVSCRKPENHQLPQVPIRAWISPEATTGLPVFTTVVWPSRFGRLGPGKAQVQSLVLFCFQLRREDQVLFTQNNWLRFCQVNALANAITKGSWFPFTKKGSLDYAAHWAPSRNVLWCMPRTAWCSAADSSVDNSASGSPPARVPWVCYCAIHCCLP